MVAGLLTLLRTCAVAYCRQANEKEHVTKKDKAKAKAKHKQGKKQEKDKREEKDKVHELLVDEVAGVEDVALSCSPTTHTPFIAVENVPCCESSSDRNQNRSDASCSAFQAVLTTQQKVIAGLSHFAAPAAAARSSLPVFYQQTSKNHSWQLARSLP